MSSNVQQPRLWEEPAKAPRAIQSVSASQHQIIGDIARLHTGGSWDADLTYGNGGFWKGGTRPALCFDLSANQPGTIRASAAQLPLPDGALRSAICDLPFLTYVKRGRDHQEGAVRLSKRFSGYYSFGDLSTAYREVLREAGRVLCPKGILAFKCQDIVHNHQLHPTHLLSTEWAREVGLRLIDLFVLVAKHRMPGPQKGQQRHARIHHSYFLVFQNHPLTAKQ